MVKETRKIIRVLATLSFSILTFGCGTFGHNYTSDDSLQIASVRSYSGLAKVTGVYESGEQTLLRIRVGNIWSNGNHRHSRWGHLHLKVITDKGDNLFYVNKAATRNHRLVKYIDVQASQISSIDIEYVSHRPHELDEISILTSFNEKEG